MINNQRRKTIKLIRILCAVLILAPLGGCFSKDKLSYPSSNATYEELNDEVGCSSRYSEDKKNDTFNSRYKNHWMTWGGKVVYAESNKVSLNLNSIGFGDLLVYFADTNNGYDLVQGEHIKVKFLMKKVGGCFTSFQGEKATIQ